MRTIIDFDSRLLRRLRAEAHRRGVSFKDLLKRLLRRGLEERPATGTRYRFPTYDMGAPERTVRLDKPLAVAETFEDEEIARELAMRK